MVAAPRSMPALTRRRSRDAREECWHVYYGNVRVGSIANRSGKPDGTDPWQWHCGFCPGSHAEERLSRIVKTWIKVFLRYARSPFSSPSPQPSSPRLLIRCRYPLLLRLCEKFL